jgi:hypothetical protein
MELDFDKVQSAMDWLADTPGGDQALQGLSDYIEGMRRQIPTTLNNAELRYVMERLIAQRSLENWDARLEPADVSGYAVQPFGALFPQATGLTSAQLPSQFQNNVRVVNYGFIIKAKIQGARF